MTDEHYMTLDEIKGCFNGPEIVFCDNPRTLFGLAIKARTKGTYSHVFWRIGPNRVANQSWTFHETTLDSFAPYHLKFVAGKNWDDRIKANITTAIISDLSLPLWPARIYDIPGVILRLFGIRWNTKAFFCSERGIYLSYGDVSYPVDWSPSPTELNLYTKASGKYNVTARYSPD